MNTSEKIPVVAKSVLVPFILITSLFALWGLANDMTNPMVRGFQKVLELSNKQASLVQLAFYGGYFTMAIPAALFVNKYSYKKGVLLGLALYAIGALLFYPAAAYESYPFFLSALYVLTFGLAFLETTSNPYILSMGAEETATRRLNFAQMFNPMGSILGLLVAQNFVLGALQSDDTTADGVPIFDTLNESAKAVIRTSDLEIIRNPYVLLGLVVLIFFVLISVVKMPQNKHQEAKVVFKDSVKRLWKQPKFAFGVVTQAFYVGAQIMCWTYVYQYAETLAIDAKSAVWYGLAGYIVFLIGRTIGTALMAKIDSGKLLMLFGLGGMLTLLGAIFLPGMLGIYSLVATSLFMSIMFPTIYGIALEGQGEDAKFGAAFLVMAIVGGALLPFLQGYMLDLGGVGYEDITIFGVTEMRFSFVLSLICLGVVAFYGRTVYKKYHTN
ncbi:L-fucose:H+ symporter permease [Maribacter sp. 6B07]|uniref:L-fucose:H+ symporter permease n=1 Tax=Maribacter TaxID=252356 RepID=UPI000C0881D6|nr:MULTISPECIES: L-fucose:H+ symporter permease [Maribacter]MBU2902082.1 L-fucose:H+ symporter permease [Maribacter dokdonensis]PHN92832.1 L-fucose:H+ symporter permease [Maribacter sp. 6B07]